MKLKFTKPFKFAHGGTQIECFAAGQIVENPSERLYQVAIQDGAAVNPDAEEPKTEAKTTKPAKGK